MLNLNKILEPAKTIAIGGHVRPDGDCVGSCMAMYQYIQNNYPDKEVDVFLEEIPSTFYRIKGTDEILHEIDESKHYDLFIVLDCGDTGRLEFSVPLFVSAGHTLCIDHHVSNICFAQDNYVVPDASSTSELVYNLIDKDKITKEIAEALYLGIVHDTGVFQYSCAGPSTFRAAAELLETGIDAADLIMDTFYEKSYARMQIFGRALVESFLFMGGKCIVSYIRKKVMDFYGVKPKDLDGIVSQLRNTRGVEVAIFMYELDQNVFKVSLRSGNEVDVSKIAGYFGGGGHEKASGVTMTGTPQDILNNLAERIDEQLKGQA
mgnify:FL=1